MKTKTAKILLIISLVSIMASCTSWAKKDWDELIDRTFYLQKFRYTYKGSSREHTYYFMKYFPMKEMLAQLEKKYNIKIDTTDFDKFIEEGDYQKNIKSVSGTFFDNDFTWYAKSNQSYEIHFLYETIFDDQNDKNISFELEILTNKKVRDRFYAKVYDKQEVLEKLAKQLENRK